MFGQILLVVIAVAVTLATAGAAAGYFGLGALSGSGGGLAGALTGVSTAFGGGVATAGGGFAALGLGSGVTAMAVGAGAGAVGSIVSQGFGVVANIQDKFSWKAVGLAAIGGAIGASGFGKAVAGQVGKLGGGLGRLANSGFGSRFISGAASNALTQGIGKVSGLQDKFSWTGVAAAGVGSAVGGAFDTKFGGAVNKAFGGGKTGQFAQNLTRSSASSIANAATRSAIDGSNFGDNIIASIPDVIGGAIGQSLGAAIGPLPAARLPGPLGRILGFIGHTTDSVYDDVVTIGEQMAEAVKRLGARPRTQLATGDFSIHSPLQTNGYDFLFKKNENNAENLMVAQIGEVDLANIAKKVKVSYYTPVTQFDSVFLGL